MKLDELDLKCEQNDCKNHPVAVVVFDGGDMVMILCDEHENELARMEGEMELEEYYFTDSNWLTRLVKRLNERLAHKDKKYTDLLSDLSKLRVDNQTLSQKLSDCVESYEAEKKRA